MDELDKLAQSVMQGKMGRREFLTRAVKLGVSAAVASSFLAACAPAPTAEVTTEEAAPAVETGEAPTEEAPAAPEIAGTLTVWSWANPNLQEVAKEFSKTYPKVDFEFTDLSWQDTHQKLAIALAAGTGAPDVVSLDGAQMQKFVKLGGLLDITERMQPFVNDFPPYKIRESSDDKGRIFSIPWDIGPVSLFYRKDIFEENDVALPETWDEYIEIGKKLARKGHYMMAISLTTPQPQDVAIFEKLLWQNGGSFFAPDGSVTLDNDKGIEAMEMYARLAFSGISVEVPPFTPGWFGAWKEDKIVTEPGAAWMLHVFVDFIKEGEGSYGQWRVADQLPAFTKGGTPTSNLGGSNVAVTAQTKNPEAAWAYASFTCASVPGQAIMTKMGTFSAYMPVFEEPDVKDATFGVYGDQKVILPFVKLTPLVPTTYWRDSAFPEADVILNAGLNHILNKRWTPEEGIKAIANQIRQATLRP